MGILAARRRVRPTYLYAWRTGLIEMSEKRPPRGAIAIFRFNDKLAGIVGGQLVSARARHGYGDDRSLLVPGVPEAETDDEAIEALCRWVDRIMPDLCDRLPRGRFVTYRNEAA